MCRNKAQHALEQQITALPWGPQQGMDDAELKRRAWMQHSAQGTVARWTCMAVHASRVVNPLLCTPVCSRRSAAWWSPALCRASTKENGVLWGLPAAGVWGFEHLGSGFRCIRRDTVKSVDLSWQANRLGSKPADSSSARCTQLAVTLQQGNSPAQGLTGICRTRGLVLEPGCLPLRSLCLRDAEGIPAPRAIWENPCRASSNGICGLIAMHGAAWNTGISHPQGRDSAERLAWQACSPVCEQIQGTQRGSLT